jgi:aromatic-L-amino-acid decarboxylase
LQHHVREHVSLAQEFAGWVKADPKLELAVDPPLNLVCFRHTDGDDATQTLLDQINATGKLYLTHTRLDDKLTIRFSVGGTWTQRHHVEQAWGFISTAEE